MPRLLYASLLGSTLAMASPVDFNRDVRPLLNERCMACHGGVRQAGGLSLQFPEDIVRAGESGEPGVIPGKPELSEVIRRLQTDDEEERMPKEKPALSPSEIAMLRAWVAEGATWDRHWSFVPPEAHAPPAVRQASRVKSFIDAFVLSRLEAEGLEPAPEADRATLLRRVTLDLTGLPPTPEEVDAFLADVSPGAYERVVDRLLASPRYGERWAAMWLDIVRYGDSKALGHDSPRPIWPYRDWVIRAFNQDMPWDQFIIRQMAGDMLPGDARDPVATGFHRLTKANDEGGTIDEEYRIYAVVDRVNTTWGAFMGLQMACAQCHGHPYDPIKAGDYYGSFAFLNQSQDDDRQDDQPTMPYPEDPAEERRLRRAIGGSADGPGKEALLRRLEQLPKVRMPIMAELPADKARPTHILVRGAWNNRGERLASAFTPASLHPFPAGAARDRLGFARWIASAENPLVARVAVNYLWQELFGTGLVATSEDFGTMGERPSHPELLDTLAHRLVHDWGWSMKRAAREMVLSATYRQDARRDEALRMKDPGNRKLAAGPRKRLSGEMVRDQALAASGLLRADLAEGPPFVPPSPGGYLRDAFTGKSHVSETTGDGRYRRSVYGFWKRLEPFAVLGIFDAPDRDACATRRILTNSPLQALAGLNEDVLVEAQKALAKRLLREGSDDRERLDRGLAMFGAGDTRGVARRTLADLLEKARRDYRADPGLARKAGLSPEEAAWWQVAVVLLNSDAAMNR